MKFDTRARTRNKRLNRFEENEVKHHIPHTSKIEGKRYNQIPLGSIAWLHGNHLGLHGSNLNHGPTRYLLHGGGHGIHGRRLKSGGRGRGREAGLGHFRRWGCLRRLNRIHDPVNDEQKKLKKGNVERWWGGRD